MGIFLIAFYIKYIKAQAIFWSALVTQCIVIVIYFEYVKTEILSYLWLNVIGAALTILLSLLVQPFFSKSPKELEL